ncbi:hypothetical protein INT45_009917 [Circinella minor]|uniref:Uncharacterized protein n=1 Tax=Circinella minor TaxID=1195481 RepID=A0A8H7VEX8_9FUNG|nr:hypothetical protein INT45_009917 [Circinella minor]
MTTTKVSDSGKDYFYKVTPRKWNFREAFGSYQSKLNLPSETICQIMATDLTLIRQSKMAFEEPVKSIPSDLDFYVKQMKNQQSSQQQQNIIADSVNDNYNNCSNITKNIYQKSSDVNEKTKTAMRLKLVNYNLPNPHSDDDILECTRQEYEVNMEEQRVLHCFRKKSRTFDLLEICLDGSLNELMDRIDEIKANVEDNDDEKQNIRLLRYILSDYHANCTKPSYILLPNERTPFAEYVIPIFKYFSASTQLLSFIWCKKGSPSNKQLMLCLSESQRKLLDGIGFSCKDKVERVMMECSGYVR